MAREAAASNRWIVREFQSADLLRVVQIACTSAEASQWDPESYSALAATRDSLLLVAESSSGVSGFLAARFAASEAEILNLAVRVEARRAGAASALLGAALNLFDQLRLTSVFLEVRESNTAAIALYQKFGFSISNRRKAYYRDPDEDAVCMMKKLTGDPS